MNAIILHGIARSCRAKSLPINEIDMGAASDANVYTFTRFAVRTGLPGRPVPHGRRSLQTTSRHGDTAVSPMGTPVCRHSWDTGVPSSHVGGQTAPASRLTAAPRPGRSRGRYRAPAGAAASRREISTATLCCSRYSEPLLIAPGPDLISVSEPLPDLAHQVASGPISDSMDGSFRYRSLKVHAISMDHLIPHLVFDRYIGK